MSTCRIDTDRSIRSDASSFRFEFANRTISRRIWVTGNLYLADPRTKTDSNLCKSLQLPFATGQILFDFTDAIVQSSDQFTV